MASHRLIIDDMVEFLDLEIPPREEILKPWLFSQGTAMIHAYRGIGKTHIALGVACAVSTGGSFFSWQASKAHRVVFVDGEMPAITVQERLKAQFAAMRKVPEPGFFRLISRIAKQGDNPADRRERSDAIDLVPRVATRRFEAWPICIFWVTLVVRW